MQNNFHTWLPDRKPQRTTTPLDPVDFFNECILKSKFIKNKDDRKQFMDWATRFKDGVVKTAMSDLDRGLADVQGLPNNKYEKPLFTYYVFTPILFDGVEGITRVERDGSITLSRGDLSFSDSSPDEIYPMEMWTKVARANPYEMLDIIIDQYNNVDNRYMCKLHGEIRYKRHNGPWTSK